MSLYIYIYITASHTTEFISHHCNNQITSFIAIQTIYTGIQWDDKMLTKAI